MIYTAPCITFWMPNPLPLAQVMDMHTSKTLSTGLYKSQVHTAYVVLCTRSHEIGLRAHTEGVEEQVHKGTCCPCSGSSDYKTYQKSRDNCKVHNMRLQCKSKDDPQLGSPSQGQFLPGLHLTSDKVWRSSKKP